MEIQAKISTTVHKWDRIYVCGKEKTTQLTAGLEEICTTAEKKRCWSLLKKKAGNCAVRNELGAVNRAGYRHISLVTAS
jgi:hypothetical protein